MTLTLKFDFWKTLTFAAFNDGCRPASVVVFWQLLFWNYHLLLFSQIFGTAMQMKLLSCIKEDCNKIFHARLLMSYDLFSCDVITDQVSWRLTMLTKWRLLYIHFKSYSNVLTNDFEFPKEKYCKYKFKFYCSLQVLTSVVLYWLRMLANW